jgi:hypothetical protein
VTDMSETWEWFVFTLAIGLVWPIVALWALDRFVVMLRKGNQ